MSRRRLSRPHTFRRTASAGALVLFTSVLVPALPGGTAFAAPPPAPRAGALDASFGDGGFAVAPQVPDYVANDNPLTLGRPLLRSNGSVGLGALHTSASPGAARTSVFVRLSDFGGFPVDVASVTDAGPEFTVSQSGAGLTVDGAGTLVTDDLYRYSISGHDGSFITIGFLNGSWANTNGVTWNSSDYAFMAADATPTSRTGYLAQLTEAGTVDTTFGETPIGDTRVGAVEFPIPGDDLAFRAEPGHVVAAAPDGGTYVGGVANFFNGEGFSRGIAVQRFDADGDPDLLWGAGSLFVAPFSGAATALAVQDDGKVLIGARTSSGWRVFRLLTTGAADTSWSDTTLGIGGSFQGPAALGVDGTGRVYLAGRAPVGEFGSEIRVARLRTDGALDGGLTGYGDPVFEGSGYQGTTGRSAEAGFSFTVSDMAVADDGTAWVVGSRDYGDFVFDGYALKLSPDAHESEPAVTTVKIEGLDTQLEAAALDAEGRLIVAGAAELDGYVPGLARLTTGGSLDSEFGALNVDDVGIGSETATCTGGLGFGGEFNGVTVDADGRIVAVGTCGDGEVVAARFLGSSDIGDLELTVDAPTVVAAPSTVDTDTVPADALESALADLASSPLRFSPLRFSPLRFSPLRFSPLRFSPVDSDLVPAETTLAQVPLAPPGDWDAILTGTKYANHPLQSVYVRDVLALLEDSTVSEAKKDEIEAINLDRIDLSNSGMRDSGLAAVLLGGTKLGDLGDAVPLESWCSYTTTWGDGFCANPSNDTLMSLEINDVDLTEWLERLQPLRGAALADSPLASIRLTDIDLSRTALGKVLSGTLENPERFCTNCADDLPLDEATLVPDATLGQLLFDGLPSTVVSPAASIADLLAGLVAPEEIPWEGLDVDDIVDALPIPADLPSRTYSASFTADCAVLTELTVGIQLPMGSRFIESSITLTSGASDVPWDFPPPPIIEPIFVADPDILLQEFPPYLAIEPGGFECTGPTRFTYSVDAVAPRVLGTDTADAFLYKDGNAGSLSAQEQAPLTVLDPHDEFASGPRRALTGSTLELGYLGHQGAADYYTLPVTPGQTVTLTLSHLPADYDLIVYDEIPIGPDGIADPIENTPLRFSPLRFSPLRFSPTDDSEPAVDAEIAPPEDLQGVPLLPLRIRAASAAREQQVEAVRIHVRDGEPSSLIVGVVPFNGAQAATPYVLHTHVEGAPVLPDCVDVRILLPVDLDPRPLIAGSVGSDTQTVIIADRGRMEGIYGFDHGDPDVLWNELLEFAQDPKVGGVVLDVGADPDVALAYAAMDADPCSIPKINAVVSEINRLVDETRAGIPTLRFLTIVGNDDVIPMGRIPDLTDIANQEDYAPATRVGEKDNPVSRSFATRYLLSDDPYAALAPSAYLDTQLFVPDLAVGRLVETPEEITATLQDFDESGGVRTLDSAFVASYDFLTDLGQDLTDLSATDRAGTTTSRNDDTWTHQDAVDGITAGVGGLITVNGHYDNNRALPADQNAKGQEDELLLSTELPADLQGSVLVTVGCNAGVNLSDLLLSTVSSPTDREVSRTRDWAQRVSAQKGVLIANTGFGYGDAVAIAYSERLARSFVANLDGSMTVGQALQFAKQEFLTVGMAGAYDHKALQELTYYGLPQWRVGAGGDVADTVLPAVGSTPANPVLSINAWSPTNLATLRVTSPRGTWYQVPNQLPQVTAYRPVQPRLDEPLQPPAPGLRAHGAVIEALTTTDHEVDPAVSVPITDLTTAQPEPETSDAFFPSTLQQVVSRTSPTGVVEDRIVLVAGQFRGTQVVGESGVQRLVEDTGINVQWSDSTDFTPPQLTMVDGVIDTTSSDVTFLVNVPADDAERVVVLYLPQTGVRGVHPDTAAEVMTWSPLELTKIAPGRWLGDDSVPSWQEEVGQFFVQAVDAAGNVTVNSNKGFNYRAAPLDPLGMPFELGLVVDISDAFATVTVVEQQQAQSATTTAGGPTPNYAYTIDGGPQQPYTGPFQVSGIGRHLVEVTDRFGNTVYTVVELSKNLPGLVLTQPTGLQVTDPGSLSATLSDADGEPISGVRVDFTLGGQEASGTTDSAGLATATIPQVDGPAETARQLSATSEEFGTFVGVTADPLTVPVDIEGADVTYTGDQLVSTGSAPTAPVTLAATVTQDADSHLGSMTHAGVSFLLYDDEANPFDTVVTPAGGLTVSNPDTGLLTAEVVLPALPAGTITVTACVTGGWFTGCEADVPLVVYTPSTEQFVTGGGHVDAFTGTTTAPAALGADDPKGHFGLNAAFVKVTRGGGKKGSTTTLVPKGTAAYSVQSADGRQWTFRTKVIDQLAFSGGTTTTGTGKNKTSTTVPPKAALSGPVTVWMTPATEGAVRQKVVGKFTWRVDVTDNGSSDTYAVTVFNEDGGVYLQTGRATAQVPLTGGNTVVHKP